MLTLADLRPHLDNPDEADLSTACDRLQEAGATLADLLLLYRGEPPEFLGESFALDEALRKLLAKWCEWLAKDRWEAVLACELMPAQIVSAPDPSRIAELEESIRQQARQRNWLALPEGVSVEMMEPGAARREQKRRALGLFPEVTAEIIVREERRVFFWEILPAPDWIPPEPEYGPSPLAYGHSHPSPSIDLPSLTDFIRLDRDDPPLLPPE